MLVLFKVDTSLRRMPLTKFPRPLTPEKYVTHSLDWLVRRI